jgi:thiamine biosynthesis lipoprotein
MGSAISFTCSGPTRVRAKPAWLAAIGAIKQAEADLSRFLAGSELSRLNRVAGTGAWTEIGWRTAALLHMSRRAQRLTGGRFDARVVEALELLGEHAGVELSSEMRPGEPEWLSRDARTRRFRVEAAVDSGGLGKGLALRWALLAARRVLPEARGLLIEAGGDLVVSGSAPDGGAWSIGIQDPAGGTQPLAVIAARETAVATSSVAVRRWVAPDGRIVHHLIDPRTSAPADTGLLAVTVALADPAWAEVWTKALFLAGARDIGPEARSRGLAAWWVESDGSLRLTPAARQVTTWILAEAGAA